MGNESLATLVTDDSSLSTDGDARLRVAVEEAGLATWDVDLATGDAIWSANHFCLLGYPINPAGHATYEMWRSRLHPGDRTRVLVALERSRHEHSSFRCEHRVVRADNGEIVWLEARGRFFYDPTGRATRLVGVFLDTTSRKQAEERLVRRETQLDLAARIVGIGIFDHDHVGERLYWSDGLRDIHEMPRDIEPSLGLLQEHLHPEDREPLQRAFEGAHDPNGNGRFSTEYRIFRRNGEVRWIVGQAQTFFAGEGPDRHAVRTVGAELDVTERKRIEMDLRAERESLRLALDASAAGAFDWNILSGEMQWTDGHYRLFGLEPRTVAPSSELLRRYVHPEDLARVDHAIHDALASNQRFDAVFRIRRADSGAERWVEAQGLTFHQDGRPVRMVGVIVDVTDRRLAEARLRESEARFRTMADGSPVIIWATDANGSIEFINKAYCAFFGVTLEDARREGWQRGLHPEDAPAYATAYGAAVAMREPFRAQARARNAAGEWRWLETYATPRIGPQDEFLGYVGVSPDITALVEAQRALREADQRKDDFLATLAHELRNPLAPIRTAAHLLSLPNLTDTQLGWARQVIHRQVEHMARLLDDLLDVARITRGKLQLRKEHVDLTTIVDTAVEVARPLITAKNHTLNIEVPARVPALDADPVRLAQVLSNLLTNAAKYTDSPGRIALSAQVHSAVLRISVKDSGIGLSRAVLPRIFEMFSQVHETHGRSEGGLGIGLALVKGLVELHGGTVEAFSEGPGHGSEFVVTLPLGLTETLPFADPPRTSRGNAGGRRVLIADDNQDAADSLALLLRCEGHEVQTAHGGHAALELAGHFRPDIALLDIGMPDLSGYELAKQLRQASWGKSIQLIALTGWGQDEDKRRAHAAGFNHHLTKPVDLNRLSALLTDLSTRVS